MGVLSMICNLCPRNCGINRTKSKGFCGMTSSISVSKAYLHMWEEPCLSGNRGSGTVFFSGCNLKCVFCQNFLISQESIGKQVSIERLGEIFLSLQAKGAHNINLVNPTHYIPQIRECLLRVKGLNIPVVYNSNAYESIEGLKSLQGLIDVFLPDFKYCSPEVSQKYSHAKDYFCVAAPAILEMYRQVGLPEFDENGIIKRGLIIRHLILPGHTGDSIKILNWVRDNLPEGIFISLMSQYTPFYKAGDYPEINRRITRWEYEKVLKAFFKLGFKNGYTQERNSAAEEYIPDFDFEGI